jgi:hypothetical protein
MGDIGEDIGEDIDIDKTDLARRQAERSGDVDLIKSYETWQAQGYAGERKPKELVYKPSKIARVGV